MQLRSFSLRILALVVVFGAALAAWVGAAEAVETRWELRFPDLPDYRTLVCDLHMHTVFSDGAVWPTVRVDEAWRLGFHAIAITDHVEYQPHKADVPTNHNRPYELAAGPARARDILLIRGAEITRDTPPGHFNAVFIEDCARLDIEDFLGSIEEANRQGGFVFWNHQGWKGPELGRWLDVHTTIYEKKWLHGMEVCNGEQYYPDAHRWALEKNLAMVANSDIHAPDLNQRSTSSAHRTLTLVFAKQRSATAIREALFEGRTVIWYKDQLIGRKEWLEKLWEASIVVEPPHQRAANYVMVHLRNRCEADAVLERAGSAGPPSITIPAGATVLLRVPTAKPKEPVELRYTAANWLIAPGEGLPVVLRIAGEKPAVPPAAPPAAQPTAPTISPPAAPLQETPAPQPAATAPAGAG